MTLIKEFESQLKEIVQTKRLSGSKMTKLTETALKSMSDDTQMVSILYRSHKALQPSYKVNSLYVFDALSRAARREATKRELSAQSETGNSATFLIKIEGVLEGLVRDMVATSQTECKEKTKKILDIWIKGKTFPEPTLSRLTCLLAETDKEPEIANVSPSDPRLATTQPPKAEAPISTTPPPTHGADALLTLLQNHAQQTAPTTTPALATGQMLLQQLAQIAQAKKAASPPAPAVAPITHFPAPTWEAGPSESPPTANEPNGHRFRYDSPDAVNGPRTRDPRQNRDPAGRSVSSKDTQRGRDPRRARNSRSRSPPSRYGGRRDVKPHSPPRRPAHVESRNDTEITSTNGQKDEFGRDIRPLSPLPLQTINTHVPPMQQQLVKPASAVNTDIPSVAPSVPPESSATPALMDMQFGLEAFNPFMFNPLLPESWVMLGKMWEVTNGYAPSQQELMQYIAMMMASQAQPALVNSQYVDQSAAGQWQGGSFRARGGQARGRFVHGAGNGGAETETEAIVLGGGENVVETVDASAGGGSMQRVGEKWVFVRHS